MLIRCQQVTSPADRSRATECRRFDRSASERRVYLDSTPYEQWGAHDEADQPSDPAQPTVSAVLNRVPIKYRAEYQQSQPTDDSGVAKELLDPARAQMVSGVRSGLLP